MNVILNRFFEISKYAFETTIILVMLYLVYLEVNKTDVISVYTDDRKRFTSLNDIINYLDMH